MRTNGFTFCTRLNKTWHCDKIANASIYLRAVVSAPIVVNIYDGYERHRYGIRGDFRAGTRVTAHAAHSFADAEWTPHRLFLCSADEWSGSSKNGRRPA